MKKIILVCLMLLIPSFSYANQADDFYRAGHVAFDAGDFNEAYILYHKAAENGHFRAAKKLYKDYLTGRSKKINGERVRIIMPNPDKRASLIKMMGQSKNPKTLSFLGLIYQMGKGVEKNYRKSFYYYEKAVDLNEKTVDVDKRYKRAYFALGYLYSRGWGVKQNEKYGNALMCKVNTEIACDAK